MVLNKNNVNEDPIKCEEIKVHFDEYYEQFYVDYLTFLSLSGCFFYQPQICLQKGIYNFEHLIDEINLNQENKQIF